MFHLVYNNIPGGAFLSTLRDPNPARFVPAGVVGYDDGQALIAALANGPVSVTLDLETRLENRHNTNVIATSKGGNQDNIVFIGSHSDSVAAGPGLNDNGSGELMLWPLSLNVASDD